MAVGSMQSDARPPPAMREVYKRLQKSKAQDMNDWTTTQSNVQREEESLAAEHKLSPNAIFQRFTVLGLGGPSHMPAAETCEVPGLLIYRSLLPPEVQLLLLDRIFHRDLNNPEHLTNVHLHYDVPYPPAEASYFDLSASKFSFEPQDSNVHKPFKTRQFLDKKLRWMTLGGQYDWTNKVYPAGPPPAFPKDIEQLVGSLFDMKPEAAIVNLYSPGDTLSLHRDVSEECDQRLVSISLGCDGIFLVGLEGIVKTDEPRIATLTLKSGDTVVMSGESRYAWHGIPKVIGDTCPEWMEDWPCVEADADRFERWKGWMRGKRINLNVRQMFE